MLSRFCMDGRFGTLLSKWYSWSDVSCFLADASRNSAWAFLMSTACRSKTVSKCAFTHAVPDTSRRAEVPWVPEIQLLATKISVLIRCPKASPVSRTSIVLLILWCWDSSVNCPHRGHHRRTTVGLLSRGVLEPKSTSLSTGARNSVSLSAVQAALTTRYSLSWRQHETWASVDQQCTARTVRASHTHSACSIRSSRMSTSVRETTGNCSPH